MYKLTSLSIIISVIRDHSVPSFTTIENELKFIDIFLVDEFGLGLMQAGITIGHTNNSSQYKEFLYNVCLVAAEFDMKSELMIK